MGIDKEQWKDIQGFEGVYQISNLGRLKSYKGDKRGKCLSLTNKKGWYINVVLCCKGKPRRSVKVHTLVAEAFVPNPCLKPEVNHIDGDKQNNKASNLEWVTRAENMTDAVKRNPSFLEGMRHYNQITKSPFIMQFSLDGEFIRYHKNAKDAERNTGVCYRNINQVARKKEYAPGKVRKQAGGFRWEYGEVLDI